MIELRSVVRSVERSRSSALAARAIQDQPPTVDVDACRRAGAPFVHSSVSSAYRRLAARPPRQRFGTEPFGVDAAQEQLVDRLMKDLDAFAVEQVGRRRVDVRAARSPRNFLECLAEMEQQRRANASSPVSAVRCG